MTAPDHKARAHSVLGASGAHRWAACPGSIRLSEGIPDEETIYAAEGTAAHELCECVLERQLKGWVDTAHDFIGERIVVGNHVFEVDEEMAEAVQVYVETVLGLYSPLDGDVILVEQRFDLSDSVLDGMFGTSDVVVYQAKAKRLCVVDYKHGKGHAVEAKGSVQLRYYGLGALHANGFPVDKILLGIVQPRAPHADGPVRWEEIDVLELAEWQHELKDAALRTLDPNAPLAAGPWCKFCKAAGICPTLREKAIADAKAEFADAPADLDDAEISGILEKASLIEDWIKAVRKEAYTRMAGGQQVPGWKLVAKRATRRWAGDEEIVASSLVSILGIDETDIWQRKLLSPAQMEKVVPKELRADLKDYIVSESSGTTLARETDRRAAVIPSPGAVADFDPVD